MNTRSGDPAGPGEDSQRWDGVAAGWKTWWRTIEDGARHVSMRMLELAEIGPGQRVLDIATGIGEPALLAANQVGPAGRVVATDCSSQMLEIARERAATLGLTNVEFLEADADEPCFPDGSFDAILCRWGVTSLPNPLKTLIAARRMLSQDGAFVTCVWEAGPKGRPMANLATTIARDMFDLPAPEPADPVPPGSVGESLEKEMIRAGFTGVRVEEATLTLEFPSAGDCTRYLVAVSPEFSVLLSGKSSEQQTEFRQRLARDLQPYTTADGSVRIPNVAICAVGRK